MYCFLLIDADFNLPNTSLCITQKLKAVKAALEARKNIYLILSRRSIISLVSCNLSTNRKGSGKVRGFAFAKISFRPITTCTQPSHSINAFGFKNPKKLFQDPPFRIESDSTNRGSLLCSPLFPLRRRTKSGQLFNI